MLFELEYPRSVSIEPFVSENVYGARTFGTPVVSPACVEYTVKNVKDFRGNEYIADAWIALPPGTDIDYDYRVTLPNSSTPYIGSISYVYDEEAQEVEYVEVYVGRVAPGEGSL